MFPYEWAFLELVRRVPQWVPRDWAFWAVLLSNGIVTLTNLLYRSDAKRSQAESRLSRRETVLLREEVRELIGKTDPMPRFIQAPAYTKARGGILPKYVVVHSMAGTLQGSLRHFLGQLPLIGTSAHFLVGHDGDYVQMVDLEDSAHHAGNRQANREGVGIEHEGGDYSEKRGGPVLAHPLGEPGYATSARLIADLHDRYEWGEPSERTIRPHSAFKATACPSGLDVPKLIRMARDVWRSRRGTVTVPVVQADYEPQRPVGGEIPAVRASSETMPQWVPFVYFEKGRTFTVTSKSGVNVRTTPEVRDDNLFAFQRNGRTVTAFPHGATFFASGAVRADSVGGNDAWIVTEGGRYVWSGATNY